jgi:hypothetical protein
MPTTLKQMMIPQMPVKQPGQPLSDRVRALEQWARQMTEWAQFTQQALQEFAKQAGV